MVKNEDLELWFFANILLFIGETDSVIKMGVIGSHGGVIYLSEFFERLKLGEHPIFFSKFYS